MNKMMEALKAHPSALVGLLGTALVAGVAIALSTQPLVPRDAVAGSTGSSPAVAGSAAGSAQASSPTDDEAEPDAADDPAKAEGGQVADGEPGDEAAPGGGSEAGKGGESAGKPSKPGKPSSGGTSGDATQKPAAGGGQAQKPSSGGSQSQKPSKPKPGHTHSWSAVYRTEPVYSQQWVSKWEEVYTRHGRFVCNGCGAQFASVDAHSAHADSMFDWDTMWYKDGRDHGGYLDDSYTTVEKVDRGSYQNVQTGTQQVLDHYECACGARK